MTLPQKYYTSDEVLKREKERIFNRYWTCATKKTRFTHFIMSVVIAARGFAKPLKGNSRTASNVPTTPGRMAWTAN